MTIKVTTAPYAKEKAVTCSIERAVADSLEHTMADGDLERMRERLDNQAKVIGRLVAKLVDAGHLSAEDLESFLSYHYKVVVEE